jgi:hypothetical protein
LNTSWLLRNLRNNQIGIDLKKEKELTLTYRLNPINNIEIYAIKTSNLGVQHKDQEGPEMKMVPLEPGCNINI